MEQVAEEMGVGDTFHPTPVGVFFGGPEPGRGEKVADPFFGGAGPDRNTCIDCGECMTGLPSQRQEHPGEELPPPGGAAPAPVHPLTTVTDVRPLRGGGYEVDGPLDQGEALAHARP